MICVSLMGQTQRRATVPSLNPLMIPTASSSTSNSNYMTIEELREFLWNEQKVKSFLTFFSTMKSLSNVFLRSANTFVSWNRRINQTIWSIDRRQRMFRDGCRWYVQLNEISFRRTMILLQGLREMLLSDENQLMKPEHRHHVYQDMTRPITDYWINTSHNTWVNIGRKEEENPDSTINFQIFVCKSNRWRMYRRILCSSIETRLSIRWT